MTHPTPTVNPAPAALSARSVNTSNPMSRTCRWSISVLNAEGRIVASYMAIETRRAINVAGVGRADTLEAAEALAIAAAQVAA